MSYSLGFDRRALKEWNKLGDTVRGQFKKKLAEVLQNLTSRPIDSRDWPVAIRSN